MIKFRIYYGDGTTYEGDPFLAPAVNVQVVAQEAGNPRRRILMHGKDFYIWTEAGWSPADQAGFFDYLMQPGARRVLFGRTIADAEFHRIVARAAEEGIA